MRAPAPILCLLTGMLLSHCESAGLAPVTVDAAVNRHRSDGGMDAAIRDPDEDEDEDDFQSEPPLTCRNDFYSDYDGDGLMGDLELDAGLDPCSPDSDSDGCSDGLEHYLGGCDPRNAVQSDCGWNHGFEGRVRFEAPLRASGNWPRLMLRADRADVRIRLEEASNAAVQSDMQGFKNVPSGTLLTFSVWFDRAQPGDRASIALVDDTGKELDWGTVVFVYVDCPIVI